MMTQTNRRQTRSAFTLVEILVVLIIIAVLAGAIAPRLFKYVGQAKHGVAVQNVVEIEKAIEMFTYDYNRLPNTIDELVTKPADIPEDEWQLPILKKKQILDPWGRKYLYKCPGDHGNPFDLYSLGKDGVEGGEKEDDDVVNW